MSQVPSKETSHLKALLESIRDSLVDEPSVREFLESKAFEQENEAGWCAWLALHSPETSDGQVKPKNLVGIWIVAYDALSGQLHFLLGDQGVLLPEVIQSQEWTSRLTKEFTSPWNVGSSGFALRLGQPLCLSNVGLDPRGAVAVEDLLLGNMTYAAVPVRQSDDQSSPIICYVGALFPVPNAWTGKEFVTCGGQTGTGKCFVHNLTTVVKNHSLPIRLAVSYARERCIVEAFQQSAADRATEAADRDEEWRYFANEWFFEDIKPSPLGVFQVAILSGVDGTQAQLLASSVSSNHLKRLFKEQLTSQEMHLNINSQDVITDTQVRERLTELVQNVYKVETTGQWYNTNSSAAGVVLWTFRTQAVTDNDSQIVTTVLSALELAIQGILSLDTTRVIPILEQLTEMARKRIRKGLKIACCQAVCDWLTGRSLGIFETIAASLKVSMPHLYALSELLRSPNPRPESAPLIAVIQITRSGKHWHLVSNHDSNFQNLITTDTTIYHVQRYLAESAHDELNTQWGWTVGHVCNRDKSDNSPLIALGNLLNASDDVLCPAGNHARAFETTLSARGIETTFTKPNLVKVENLNGNKRLSYYAIPMDKILDPSVLKTEDCNCLGALEWSERQGDLTLAAVALSDEWKILVENSHTNTHKAIAIQVAKLLRSYFTRTNGKDIKWLRFPIPLELGSPTYVVEGEDVQKQNVLTQLAPILDKIIFSSVPVDSQFGTATTVVPIRATSNRTITHYLVLFHPASEPSATSGVLPDFDDAQQKLIAGLCVTMESRQRLRSVQSERDAARGELIDLGQLQGLEVLMSRLLQRLDVVRDDAQKVRRRIFPAESGILVQDPMLRKLFLPHGKLSVCCDFWDDSQWKQVFCNSRRYRSFPKTFAKVAAALQSKYRQSRVPIEIRNNISITLESGVQRSKGFVPIETIHSDIDITESIWKNVYQPLLYLIGVERDIRLLREIGAANTKDYQARFALAKLLLHRVHSCPNCTAWNGRTGKQIQAEQLLGVIYEASCNTGINLTVEYDTNRTQIASLVDILSVAKRLSKRSWITSVDAPPVVLLNAVFRLLSDELKARPSTGAGGELAEARSVSLVIQPDDDLLIAIDCAGSLTRDKLYFGEEAVEHGLSRALSEMAGAVWQDQPDFIDGEYASASRSRGCAVCSKRSADVAPSTQIRLYLPAR